MAEDGSRLADAVDDLLDLLPLLAELVSEPDNDGSSTRGLNPASVPPWNAAVAYVMLDVHEGARALEAGLYEELTGAARKTKRGGSNGNTDAALKAIVALGAQLGLHPSKAAAVLVERWVMAGRRLPAVDLSPVWRRLPRTPVPGGMPPVCPYCKTFSLRVAVRSRVVRCFNPGPCEDGTGGRPVGSLELGRVSGQPMLVWADGTVQVAPQ